MLKDEIIMALEKAMEEAKYHNPYFVSGILEMLEHFYGYENDKLDAWCESMWDR